MAKRTKDPEGEPEDEGGSDDDDENTADSSDDNAGGDSLTDHIREVVGEVVNSLLGERNAPSDTRPSASGPRQDEAAILKMVKDAQGKLRAEEDRDARFAEVAGKVESLEKVIEKPPARSGIAGKVQAFLWGSDGS